MYAQYLVYFYYLHVVTLASLVNVSSVYMHLGSKSLDHNISPSNNEDTRYLNTLAYSSLKLASVYVDLDKNKPTAVKTRPETLDYVCYCDCLPLLHYTRVGHHIHSVEGVLVVEEAFRTSSCS